MLDATVLLTINQLVTQVTKLASSIFFVLNLFLNTKHSNYFLTKIHT